MSCLKQYSYLVHCLTIGISSIQTCTLAARADLTPSSNILDLLVPVWVFYRCRKSLRTHNEGVRSRFSFFTSGSSDPFRRWLNNDIKGRCCMVFSFIESKELLLPTAMEMLCFAKCGTSRSALGIKFHVGRTATAFRLTPFQELFSCK